MRQICLDKFPTKKKMFADDLSALTANATAQFSILSAIRLI